MKKICFLALLAISGFGCEQNYTPKPSGYFRIELPEQEYQLYTAACPFSFEYAKSDNIVKDMTPNAPDCWFDIIYPSLNGEINISYKPLASLNDLGRFREETYLMSYKHAVIASAIQEKVINKPNKKVYGIIYEVGGNAASSFQFFLTDSAQHFVRGSIYFNSVPNVDSIAPVAAFLHTHAYKFIDREIFKKCRENMYL